MIAEVLLILAGHSSSLFEGTNLNPSLVPLVHPGERECLESLARMASRYRKIKHSCSALARVKSRYICAFASTLDRILKDEYEYLVVETEAKVLLRDANLVASGSFVPLSSIRATFSVWDAPLTALESLVEHIEAKGDWQPGPLIDLLLERANTGVHQVSILISRLSSAVQRVWRAQISAFVVHGSLSPLHPLADADYVLVDGAMPSCVSPPTRDSIVYVGRAIGTVKAAKWQKQPPRALATEHTALIESVLPEDQHSFNRVIAQIRTNVSEWLWLNVLTEYDVEDAVNTLANYFLLRNGEFSLAMIREFERLKVSRLSARSAVSSMIREQDLDIALLRASLGTSAQHDPSLSNLHFHLPTGTMRPLLPSLLSQKGKEVSVVGSSEETRFDDALLGTPLVLKYNVTWPLDLFLHTSDLNVYAALYAYFSALRKTHVRIHTCWTSLSNAQRARRKWTGLGEGGTAEDLEARRNLLRCGWGVARDMQWFLDVLLNYIMTDVVDTEFRRLKTLLTQPVKEFVARSRHNSTAAQSRPSAGGGGDGPDLMSRASSLQGVAAAAPTHLDFTTLRNIHSTYLERLVTGSLLANPQLTAIIRTIFDICERFVAQVERWGGDVLPPLLFEGSVASSGGDHNSVGAVVRERYGAVAEISETLRGYFYSFYDQLSQSAFQNPFSGDASRSIMVNGTLANASSMYHNTTTFIRSKGTKGLESEGEVRRHMERLLLRLDFNDAFSRPMHISGMPRSESILAQGGLA